MHNTTPIVNDNRHSLNRVYRELSVVENLFCINSKHKAYIYIQKRMKEILEQLENKNG
jgi:hypothetical protein